MIDGLLVAVTVFSLGMAAVMAVITWRAIRLERQQTMAKADLGRPVRSQPETPPHAAEPPTWPPARPDVRNPQQALPRQPPANPPGGAPRPAWTDLAIERTVSAAPAVAAVRRGTRGAGPLPARPASSGGKNRWFSLIVGVGALAATSAIGWALGSGGPAAAAAGASPVATRAASPLELVSLNSEHDGDRITIRGLVRNPATGTRMDQLQAVVFLFDQRGVYLGTTRAAVVQPVLPPGSESSFAVPLAAGLPVSRYRVGFRLAAAPVPHVDRRPVPTLADAGRGKASVEPNALVRSFSESP